MPSIDGIVSTDWLESHLDHRDLRVVDVRWYLDARRGCDAYDAGHIPGAVFLDVEADLAAPGGGPGSRSGRHPWPSAEQVSRVMGAAGIGPGVRVVAYDDQAGAVAARLWYVLRAHGHDEVAVLDGGFVKWAAERRPVSTETTSVAACPFPARLRADWVVGKWEMSRLPAGSLVLDARTPERYRGEREPIDPRAGHIPGAKNAPFADNLTGGPAPVFRPSEELLARYFELGAGEHEPVVYCGSGITACHDLLALHLAGLRGRLFPGSWSEWSADPVLPVAVGSDP